MFDTRDYGNVEFEEENDLDAGAKEEEEEDEKSDESDDGFRKPVDFGIDKETSIKLDKLNLMLMVGGKDKQQQQETNPNRNSVDSSPTSSRDLMESPRRPHPRLQQQQQRDDDDSEAAALRKSNDLNSSSEFNKPQLESIS